MGIKWNALSECEKRKFEKMNEQQRFIYFLLKLFGSPYGWGKETPDSSDCSGAVCILNNNRIVRKEQVLTYETSLGCI